MKARALVVVIDLKRPIAVRPQEDAESGGLEHTVVADEEQLQKARVPEEIRGWRDDILAALVAPDALADAFFSGGDFEYGGLPVLRGQGNKLLGQIPVDLSLVPVKFRLL